MSVVGILFPAFIELNVHIFLVANDNSYVKYHMDDDTNSSYFIPPYGNDRKTAGKYRNMSLVADFFNLIDTKEVSEDILFLPFADVIKYCWSKRLRDNFSYIEFEFEIVVGLFCEDGLCVTFSQK